MVYNAANSDRGESFVPNVRCHSCGKDINLDIFTYRNYKGSVTCEHCLNRQNVVISKGDLLESAPTIDPQFVLTKSQTIPEQVYNDYCEAVIDLGNQSYKSCAVMCRRSLQGALLVKGISDAKLSDMIKAATKTTPIVLPDKFEHSAKAVTFFGNSGAHPQEKEINEVGKEEATQGLIVTRKILIYLFPRLPRTFIAVKVE